MITEQIYIWICRETDLNNPQQFQVIYKLVVGGNDKFWSQYKNWNYKHVEILEKIELPKSNTSDVYPFGLDDKSINTELTKSISNLNKIFCKKMWIFPWNTNINLIIEVIINIFKNRAKELDDFIKRLIDDGLLI